MLPGAPPFVEAEAVIAARQLATRLAASSLPILVGGAIGTGRRTLTNAIGARRDPKPLTLSAFDGLDALRSRRESGEAVVMHNIHALDARGQKELAAWCTVERSGSSRPSMRARSWRATWPH